MRNPIGWVLLMALGLFGCDSTYTGCVTSAGCDPEDTCFQVQTTQSFGSFCTNTCRDDFDCERNLGFPGVCYSLVADVNATPLCYQQCDFDVDCFSTSICVEVDLGGGLIDFVCMPNNGR